ncbi:MAG TPA: type ISP restriction/modification enzyme [Clostridia bacterium]|nr:type ISP restriction/modification enzyme [Clostridia bacterium]
MKPTIESAIAAFGAKAKAKLNNVAVTGQPEEQLRAPFEHLLGELGALCNLPQGTLTAVGESSVGDLKTRPDYAISVHNALIGFIELKAPGKGADPRKFKDPHDKEQWEKLRALPNLIYTDGNAFSLWQNGEMVAPIVLLIGDIETSGSKLQGPPTLLVLFESFLSWQPVPPKSAKELAETTARLCRLLRDEVTEQLSLKSPALTDLATDWRKLLFPEATDERFADGYAQAVTFGLLMARAKNIDLSQGLQHASATLSQTSSLIGTALRLLTDNAENQATLKTALVTLTRVLDAVDWTKVSKGRPEAWLYFYEDFLEVYDNRLRKQTGSYYTPPGVVDAMVGLVDDVLRSPRFGQHGGLAAPSVTLADPATGTGTFLLGALRKIAETIERDEGQGSVKGAINAAIKRSIGFEIQLGPFAVAQLRILAEIVELTGGPPNTPVRMFVTNTLGNPNDDEAWIPGILAPLGNSRKEANKIKREEAITVVIGNPPYKEKAKGQGGWIESGTKNEKQPAPLKTWMPPSEWGISAHAKHLRNLYVYFWRWATWKVFDHHPEHNTGIVCFITVAGFLNGPGFQKMRDYLRRTCDDIWVIDCSPEGHQPEVNTRIFQGVQQPVCIVLASRSAQCDSAKPANVLFQVLPKGNRQGKFEALKALRLDAEWTKCPSDWRAPFLPESTGAWANYPRLEDLFGYNGSGVMPGRTWIIAPDSESLERRWKTLADAPIDKKNELFHPHLANGKLGDRHSKRTVKDGLPGYQAKVKSVADDTEPCISPVRYGFRSFDRQWIIPDARVINRPNPELWKVRSDKQIYLTALSRTSPVRGPAITFTGLIPDLDHYNGRGGRIFPLWADREGTRSNVQPHLLSLLTKVYGSSVSPEDFLAYIAATVAHPAFTARFRHDLSTPGIRIPVTSDSALFKDTVELGQTIIWLHSFGERMTAPTGGRPAQPPRLPVSRMPRVPLGGEISQDPAAMPDVLSYDAENKRLLIGQGYVENVEPDMWNYEVSGKQVLMQWFSYRKANRERPLIGDRRPPSPLGDIQPNYWLAEYTTELLNLLNVLGLLVDLEPRQAHLLECICGGPIVSAAQLIAERPLTITTKPKTKKNKSQAPTLFGDER